MGGYRIIEKCKAGAMPWEAAKAYDNSSPLGAFIKVNEFKDVSNIAFSIFKNNHCIAASKYKESAFFFRRDHRAYFKIHDH